jgi:hypothetical protein
MRPPKTLWHVLGVGVASLLLAPGCESGNGHLVPVHGKVSYQGRLIRRGTIVFTPDARRGASGPIAWGEIQPDGSYALSTGAESGAAPGWYRITITALETAGLGESQGSFPTSRPYLPDRYRDPELSGLVCQIPDLADNAIDFNLD